MHSTEPENVYNIISDVMDGLTVAGGGHMTEAAKEARRAYKREWNRRNKDKVKAAQERYWNKRAEEAAEAIAKQTAGTVAMEG